MSDFHEVISAFLDDRPFRLEDLAAALDDPSSRSLLIDLLALRRIVQPTETVPLVLHTTPAFRFPRRLATVAAVVLLALVGGYLVGLRKASPAQPEAPAPTRVVETTKTWQEIPLGGQR